MYNTHNTANTWQPPPTDGNSPISSAAAEFRKRSLPSHIIESQKKEALAMVVTEKQLQSESEQQPQPQQLSFFQRHFYRPVQPQNEDDQSPPTYHFSFLSRGFLASAAVSCLVIITILCAVLATVYERNNHKERVRLATVQEAVFANFPDPALIKHENMIYALATTNAAGILSQPHNKSSYEYGRSNIQIATSIDNKNWTLLDSQHDPLPVLGGWVKKGFTKSDPPIPLANVWAPAVMKRPSDGKFILYYSAAVEHETRTHCLGAAISNTSSPAGPYEPLNTTIACPIDEGGAIDPAPFVDVDGTIYLSWKVDGNNRGHGGICGNTIPPLVNTPIKLQKMQADGVTAAESEAITILDRTDEDGPLVEAPLIVRSKEGIYFLFFSSGCTRAPSYDVKYAWAHSVEGPYTRAKESLLKTGNFELLAPGSVGIVEGSDGLFEMAFHARVSTTFGKIRTMYTATLRLSGTSVELVRS